MLQERLEDLRAKIEQAKYARHRLVLAEAVLDKKLRMAEMRRKEVGFVNDLIVDAGREYDCFCPREGRAEHRSAGESPELTPVHPLNEHTRSVADTLAGLHSRLASLDPADVPVPQLEAGTDAWEAGRQAYLRWALGRAMAEHGDRTDELAQIEKDVRDVGDVADLEAQTRR